MDRLAIGIDGYNLARRHGTGVATYGFALARALKRGGHTVQGVFGLDVGAEASLRDVMFFDALSRRAPSSGKASRRSRRVLGRAALPFLRMQAEDVPLTSRVERGGFRDRLPEFDRLTSAPRLFEVAFRHFAFYKRFVRVRMTNPPPIMHWTYPVPVEVEGALNVYTLHDLVPLKLPYTTLDVKGSYAAIVGACVKQAAHVCTVSEASRRDIVEQLDADPARVTNTYQCSTLDASATALPAEEDARMVESILGLKPQGYFLFFGAIEPKKNVGRLIEAYLSIQTETPLVIVGSSGWQSEDELRLLAGNSSTGVQRVVKLDYLPRELLTRLIRSARAVVFPSLYEGFGLPVLEAMQLATPVLTSHGGSLPEVVGDGALVVDPYDVAMIARGLVALDTDEALRRRLSQAGLAQSEHFSEANYIRRLDSMYARILENARTRR
ncbi:glycosyltransferase family 4 protein [Sphingomonas sp.]|uniref:glycosyltransferase family 4 protein n=1 Tax=Sphingomonas sp. TaxID=28214 RepID=UPI003AFF89CB